MVMSPAAPSPLGATRRRHDLVSEHSSVVLICSRTPLAARGLRRCCSRQWRGLVSRDPADRIPAV